MALPPRGGQSGQGEVALIEKEKKRRVRRMEARGLLVIALAVLLLTIVRYWRAIPWMAR
jgi:hypothetical protein